MKSNLSPDWFSSNPIDFEYKQWIVLAYLRDINNNFESNLLYPHLSEIGDHLKNAETWKYKREIYDKGSLSGIDWEKKTLLYDTPENSKEIVIMNDIIDWSISKFRVSFDKGRKIFRKIEDSLIWEIIGIVPQYKMEGYILYTMFDQSLVDVYQYKISKLIYKGEDSFGISMDKINTLEYGIGVYDKVREDLIKHGELPVSLTLSIKPLDKSLVYPKDESVLPIIKRIGMNKILSI